MSVTVVCTELLANPSVRQCQARRSVASTGAGKLSLILLSTLFSPSHMLCSLLTRANIFIECRLISRVSHITYHTSNNVLSTASQNRQQVAGRGRHHGHVDVADELPVGDGPCQWTELHHCHPRKILI